MRLPFQTKVAEHEQISKCLHRTAARTELNEYQVAHAMAVLLEEIADAVSHGDIVTIPGFGRFGAMVSLRERSTDRAFPGFVGAQSFQAQVAAECPLDKRAHEAMVRYRRYNHPSSGNGRKCAGGEVGEEKPLAPGMRRRTRGALYVFVKMLRKRAREVGIDLGGYDD